MGLGLCVSEDGWWGLTGIGDGCGACCMQFVLCTHVVSFQPLLTVSPLQTWALVYQSKPGGAIQSCWLPGRLVDIKFPHGHIQVVFKALSLILWQHLPVDRSLKSSCFGIPNTVWEHRWISTETKLKFYHADVLPTLLFASKTWTVYRWHTGRLNYFHLSSLCKILKIKWQAKVPNTKVLATANMPIIHTMLMRHCQMGWPLH